MGVAWQPPVLLSCYIRVAPCPGLPEVVPVGLLTLGSLSCGAVLALTYMILLCGQIHSGGRQLNLRDSTFFELLFVSWGLLFCNLLVVVLKNMSF